MFTLLAQITNPVIGELGKDAEEGGPLTALLGSAINLLLVIGALLLLIFIIIAGINWLTAEGKPESVEKARNTLVNAITGIIIIAAAIAITSFIGRALGIDFLKTLRIEIPSINQ